VIAKNPVVLQASSTLLAIAVRMWLEPFSKAARSITGAASVDMAQQ
jgi:hypothetical protein